MAEIFLQRAWDFIQGILENKASEFITPERVAMLTSLFFWVLSVFYNLSPPNQAILILAAFVLTLMLANLGTKLWDWWKGNSSVPTTPNGGIKAEAPQSDDTLENTEQKKRFMLFVRQKMDETCHCLLATTIVAFGILTKREENILRYSVDPYIFFMKPLRTTQATLLNLLDGKERLSNKDFISAQNLLVELYKTYEHRRPWVRDMAWEIFEDFPTTNYYKQWQKLDRDMQEELGNLLHDSRILADSITDLHLPATRR